MEFSDKTNNTNLPKNNKLSFYLHPTYNIHPFTSSEVVKLEKRSRITLTPFIHNDSSVYGMSIEVSNTC